MHSFELHQPHDELTVVGRSVVETTPQPEPRTSLSWSELHDEQVRDQFAELLAPTAYVPTDHRLRDASLDLISDYPPALAGLAAIEWVRR